MSVIILTFNEAKHIDRCIKKVATLAKEIVVIDSYSTDDTAARAHALGARVLQHRFVNYSDQLNWALDNVTVQTDWLMRLDADEYPSERLTKELREQLAYLPSDVWHCHSKTGKVSGKTYPLWRFWINGCITHLEMRYSSM
jgi:glycosyltransferase involved in cell wall biosynthesis